MRWRCASPCYLSAGGCGRTRCCLRTDGKPGTNRTSLTAGRARICCHQERWYSGPGPSSWPLVLYQQPGFESVDGRGRQHPLRAYAAQCDLGELRDLPRDLPQQGVDRESNLVDYLMGE
jgi:hypothetical protein